MSEQVVITPFWSVFLWSLFTAFVGFLWYAAYWFFKDHEAGLAYMTIAFALVSTIAYIGAMFQL
jgi:hypothetical protein